MRLSYEKSCERLKLYLGGKIPPLPSGRPQYDDEVLGVSFFRTRVEGDLSNLTIPRTFFGRTEVVEATFRGSDLTESTLCWNDFIAVDFTDAILAQCDFRASIYDRVTFVNADLRHADLRLASYTDCIFTKALMRGAILTRAQKAVLALSKAQIAEIAWTDEDGDEPGGG